MTPTQLPGLRAVVMTTGAPGQVLVRQDSLLRRLAILSWWSNAMLQIGLNLFIEIDSRKEIQVRH
jgi:hypothetical protein